MIDGRQYPQRCTDIETIDFWKRPESRADTVLPIMDRPIGGPWSKIRAESVLSPVWFDLADRINSSIDNIWDADD